MHIDEVISAVHDHLAPWAQAQKGRLVVATDPFNVLEILATGPRGFVVVLGFGGDEALGEEEQNPLATATVEVTVGYCLGLDIAQGLLLFKAKTDRPSLLGLVSACRAQLLALTFADDGESGRFLAYGGCEPVTLPDGFPLAAYKVRARLDMAVEVAEPDPEPEEDGPGEEDPE